ncbi:hypothetical protein Pelo_9750 [Pelomyxa schiedti]|nr:hypothetical protein Pelo_9750 [Pelomyxa schiedti]
MQRQTCPGLLLQGNQQSGDDLDPADITEALAETLTQKILHANKHLTITTLILQGVTPTLSVMGSVK